MRSMRCFGLFAVLGVLSCSFIVDTDELDSGCGADKKLCAGACVEESDPAYGCLENVCEPCRRDNGIPVCGETGCEYDTCLYGWGCEECTEQVLFNEEHCGACDNACDPDETCSVGVCVQAGAGGAGGESGT